MQNYLKDIVFWFINADVVVSDGRNGQTVKLGKKHSGEATRKEVKKFLQSRNYPDPYQKPSDRVVYKWIEELERDDLIEVKRQKRTAGRPLDILHLTDKGKKHLPIIRAKLRADILLTSPTDLLFTLGPQKEYLTIHAITYDKDLTQHLWAEIEKLNQDREKPLRGRFTGDVLFKNHPIFATLGKMIFLQVLKGLMIRKKSFSAEDEAKC